MSNFDIVRPPRPNQPGSPHHSAPNRPPKQHRPDLPEAPPPDSKQSKSDRFKGILSTVLLLIAAPIIALLLTMFVFQSYQVDGPSMEPTLQHNDRLVIVKTGKTWARITGSDYIPARGEIIVFSKLGLYESGTTREKQLIKRVIGLPGDRVVVSDGVLTVYNKEHPDGFQPDKELGYGSHIGITAGNVDITVKDGEVFVAGDNRANSLDSRSFGNVSSNEIVGELALRIFPLNKAESF